MNQTSYNRCNFFLGYSSFNYINFIINMYPTYFDYNHRFIWVIMNEFWFDSFKQIELNHGNESTYWVLVFLY